MSLSSASTKYNHRDNRQAAAMISEDQIEYAERGVHAQEGGLYVETPNRWALIRCVLSREHTQHGLKAWCYRHKIREPAAEFLGTLFLVMFGLASNCQATLYSSPTVQAAVGGPKGVCLFESCPLRTVFLTFTCFDISATGLGLVNTWMGCGHRSRRMDSRGDFWRTHKPRRHPRTRYIPRLPLAQSSHLLGGATPRRMDWSASRICELFPRDRFVRGWTRC